MAMARSSILSTCWPSRREGKSRPVGKHVCHLYGTYMYGFCGRLILRSFSKLLVLNLRSHFHHVYIACLPFLIALMYSLVSSCCKNYTCLNNRSHLISAPVVFATFVIGFGGYLVCLVTLRKQSYIIHRRYDGNVDVDFLPAEPEGKSCFGTSPKAHNFKHERELYDCYRVL